MYMTFLYLFAVSFSMMVAAGPFTTSDNFSYEPLKDLMRAVQKDKPDLLIMVSLILYCIILNVLDFFKSFEPRKDHFPKN